MSSTDRQSRLLATEDWKAIYQSFRNADFQSYDFDNLRRTMINYLRQNYPEDFNDYIESSEYLALIDLIAFLGQNLSFRVDLNARENFLETAERRESVLRLARLISYNPSRNLPANGLLKFESISTTESVKDSTGLNLAGTVVRWNDRSNTNYFEQFIKILNSALPVNNSVGRPLQRDIIAGVTTEQYRINALNTAAPLFNFSKSIEGVNTRFEVVSTAINNGNIVEEPPLPGNNPAFLYRDDGQGAGSGNSGFFMHFRQGKMEIGNFQVTNPTPNQIVAIDATNINDSDVWLYSTDTSGFESALWTKLDAVEGNNVIYNSLFNGNRNLYAVTTRIEDRINLVFSDGVFGNLPSGNFKIYYRTSANANSTIVPGAMQGIKIEIPYISKNNTTEVLKIGLSLKTAVSNGRPTETNADIKQNAPATYYTQNRLVTAEDYNIGPLGISQDIIKTKSVNRIASGISRYYDLKDPSGKYSNTSVFADDGVIYKEEFTTKTNFTFNSQSDVEGIIYNVIEPMLSNENAKNFYLSKYPKIIVDDLNATWNQVTSETNRCTGYFQDLEGIVYGVGSFVSNNLKLVEVGTMCRFTAPTGFYFLSDGTLTADSTKKDISNYKWSKVVQVVSDGTTLTASGLGPITFNDNIPAGAVLNRIIPALSKVLITDVKTQIIDRTFSYKDYALRYDQTDRQWKIITSENINTINNFTTGKAGDDSGKNLDSSWLLYFKTDGEKYTITKRNLRYVFESSDEVRFFFDSADKIYNPKTGQLMSDQIKILSINTKPDQLVQFSGDYQWSISDAYRDSDGYVDTKKIQLKFYDSDDDGVIDNPEIFEDIVNETVNPKTKYIFQKKYTTTDGVEDFKYINNPSNIVRVVQTESEITPVNPGWVEGQVFYIINDKVFKTLNISKNNKTINTEYKAFVGRDNIKFHYIHVADSNYRIDPASSNIIDTYVLSKDYDTEVRKYLKGGIDSMPLPPSSDQLYRTYGASINKIKSISDEVIYHPVKYKMLFGPKAREDLQVTFKIVKNPAITSNTNELRSAVVDAINRFFAIEYWNFGDTFYFQELSAYIMNTLSPELVSIVIVPKQASQSFGSLFEIKSESDEIFVNAAQVTDVELIDEITATNLQASGNIITSVSSGTNSIQSA